MIKNIIKLTLIIFIIFLLSSCDLVTSNDGPYKVTFDSNGGTEVETLTVDQFDPFLPLSIPTKEGYVFAGWFIDETLLYPMSFNTGTNEPLTLYAKWISVVQILTDENIRAVVQSILDNSNLSILSTSEMETIVNDIISQGGFIDYDHVVQTVLSHINVIEAFENHIIEMLEEVMQSVVMIETYSFVDSDGSGSGVIYKKVNNTYYVLTNEHVIDGHLASNLSLTIFDKTGEIKIPRGDITIEKQSVIHDLAIISFTSTKDLRVIELGSKDLLRQGQLVYAVGSPLDLPNTVSMGMLSFYDRFMTDGEGMNTTMIQHTASINPGNSGGALVDSNGKLIGINSMSYVDETLGEGIEGLHFAVQIDVILEFINI